MLKISATLLLSLLLMLEISKAQCPVNVVPGNYVISANTTLNAGTYNVSGDFTVNAGVTLTIAYNGGCPFTMNATNISILGTINADGAGGQGGSGGTGGGTSGGAGGYSEAGGGGGGNPGNGTGAGSGGNNGGNATGGCAINCGGSIFGIPDCIGGNDAQRGGGGGGAGGSGGSYGNTGGPGGGGAAGRLDNEPGNSDCGSVPVPGNGGGGVAAPAAYGITADASDLSTGSGGGGAGGGGGGYTGGSTGGNGGNGGGAVNLNATGNLTVGGTISANGTNGSNGGDGGVRSGGNDWNCDACGNPDGGGNNTCRDASLCGICTYYTWVWPGGAGGGAGGGSGGAIKLQAIGIMSVTGALTTDGGSGGNAGGPGVSAGACNHYASGGGAGAGGVIKFVYDPCAPNTFAPAIMEANAGTPGTGTDGNQSSNTAGNGTLFNQTANIYFPGYSTFTTPSVGSSQSICSGTLPADLTSTNVGGGTGVYTFQWYSSTTNSAGQTGSNPNPAAGWTAVTGGVSANLTGATIGAINTTTYFQLLVQSGPCYLWSNAVVVAVAPSPIINGVTPVNVLCNGGSTGSISISASGGTPSYTYSDNGGSTYQAGNVFGNLPAGNYNIYVQDANTCSSAYGSNPVVISEPAVLTAIDSAIDASCANVFDGSILILASGGTAPYQYALNGGSNQSGNTFFGLSSGTYNLQTTDANGCSVSGTATIGNSDTVTGSLVSKTNVSCFGGSDGTATVQLTGGVQPYSYSINGSTFQSSPTFTGLPGGNYVVTLRDARGCTDFVLVQIIQPFQLQVLIDSVTNLACNGSGLGAIYTSPTGGTPGFSYAWSNGDTTQNIDSLAAGAYHVTVTDSKGCSAASGATVTQPLALFVNIASYHNLKCFNDSSGSIETAASGGTPPYSFAWSNSSNYENIYALQPGTYTLTVTDANQCVDTISQNLIQPTQISKTISGNSVTCAAASNGSVNFTLTGGTPPYAYLWNNGATTQNLSNVPGGLYVVIAQDANGCPATDSLRLTEPDPIALNAMVNNAACYGTASGSINLQISGGTPGYTYAWSNGTHSQNISAIPAGTYAVLVTDSNGCTKADSFELGQSLQILANLTSLSPVCHGTHTGAIITGASGGNPPYSYLWSNSLTTPSIQNLPAGTYSVTITDATNCTASAEEALTESDSITVTASVNGAKCFNTASGVVTANATGGLPPYTYLVNGIQQLTDTFNNLPAGNYGVLVIDANGCQSSSAFTIASPGVISVKLTTADQAILTGMESQLVATAVSDTTILNYIWSPDSLMDYLHCNVATDCPNPYAAPKVTTTFTVTVLNADSCYATDTITISVENQAVSFIPTAFTPNGDGLNDHFQFAILGANTIDVSIYNRWGEQVYHNAAQTNGVSGNDGWDGTVNGKAAPDDSYVYQMKVTYFDGSVKTKSGTVTVVR